MPERAAAQTVFDSVSQFSAAQGNGGWQYGFYIVPNSSASFTQLSTFVLDANPLVGSWWAQGVTQPPWTLLWATGGHPNGTNSGGELWAARRWTSNHAQELLLQGGYRLENVGETEVRILVDGAQVFTALASPSLTNYYLSISLNEGSVIDFLILPRGSDRNDSTTFFATASVVPEPTTFALLSIGLLGLVLGSRILRSGRTVGEA
jgi:hypothetical protein